jgi:hypothetical protein
MTGDMDMTRTGGLGIMRTRMGRLGRMRTRKRRLMMGTD